MPAVWFALKRSLQCKTEQSGVHDPRNNLTKILTKKSSSGRNRSGCSRSIANLKDVINGSSKRHMEKPPESGVCSPRSIGSSELLNPITHEVVLNNSTCELKVTSFGSHSQNGNGADHIGTFMGTLKPGTPGPGGHLMPPPRGKGRNSAVPLRKSHSLSWRKSSSSGFDGISIKPRADSNGNSSGLSCRKCGEQLVKWESVEAHHLSKHAVTELVEGDSSRKIVELIYGTSWSKPNSNCCGIERILKVHNMQKTLAQFEEYREMVKIKASKLPKKHPRCLADGNELLRFYGTTIECSLGINGSSSLCSSDKCNICRILRHGFISIAKELDDRIGVFTTSTSERAFESIQFVDSNNSTLLRKALMICRVIAGRVHRPLENIQELVGQLGFDSLAGKVGLYANTEELYLLNSRALLPCFVIVCKP